MTSILNYQKTRRQFNWYVWNNGKQSKFHSKKIAISYMQLTEGLLVNMNVRVNPEIITHKI